MPAYQLAFQVVVPEHNFYMVFHFLLVLLFSGNQMVQLIENRDFANVERNF